MAVLAWDNSFRLLVWKCGQELFGSDCRVRVDREGYGHADRVRWRLDDDLDNRNPGKKGGLCGREPVEARTEGQHQVHRAEHRDGGISGQPADDPEVVRAFGEVPFERQRGAQQPASTLCECDQRGPGHGLCRASPRQDQRAFASRQQIDHSSDVGCGGTPPYGWRTGVMFALAGTSRRYMSAGMARTVGCPDIAAAAARRAWSSTDGASGGLK